MTQKLSVEWGRIVDFEGKVWDKKEKDVMLRGKKAVVWNWKVTGMSHIPGVRPGDITDFIQSPNLPKTVIFSRGFELALEITNETLFFCARNGIKVELAQTTEAVERYNELVETMGDDLVGFIHSTC